MYRKLKNILGVSLMVLAILISQLPMPEANAEVNNAHTVTFSMNGGNYNGDYNGYSFKNQTPVLVIDHGRKIDTFPDDKFAVYTGYNTEKGVWYTDKKCLNKYDEKNNVNDSITLYKKWYSITSDGTTPAQTGFYISPDGSILYKYDGDDMHVKIPKTVTTIADNAFGNLEKVRGITLPENISNISDNAFSGLKDGSIIYIYDSDTANSKEYGKQLNDKYEQLVYSKYLDIEAVEEIAGIDYKKTESVEEKTDEKNEIKKTEPVEEKKEEKKEEESVKEEKKEESVEEKKETESVEEKKEEKQYTVVFHMNGGGYTGNYAGTSYTDTASLKAIVPEGKGVSSSQYPESDTSSAFKYSSYSTDSNWYTDKECLNIYEKKKSDGSDKVLNNDLTLYKKWYYTSSGFTMNTDATVLYKYNGGAEAVVIPETVTVIGENAFSNIRGITSITLPDNISDIKVNAFSGADKISEDIIISGKNENAINKAKALSDQYKHLVYKEIQNKEAQDKTAVLDTDSIVSVVKSGSIKLGAASLKNTQKSADTASAVKTVPDTTQNNSSVQSNSNVKSSSTVQNNSNVQSSSTVQSNSTVEKAEVLAASEQTGKKTASAKTTEKKNISSASAPRSTSHVKDATPKTGDPMQYRMLIVCALFSIGVLLVLTGNGKRKKSSAF